MGLRCRQNKAPKMEAIQGNEKGRKLHAVASLFEPLLVAFSFAARCMNRGLKLRPFPRRGPKMKNPFTIEKVSLVPSSAQKRKVYQSSDNTGSAYFCSLHYITFHYVSWHYILHYTLHKVKLRYITKH